MNTKTTISITEARKKIFDIAKKVQHPNIIYTLTDKGSPKVVMMSADEFESWMETLEVSKDFPGFKKDILKFEKDKANKKHKDYTSLEDLVEEYK